MNTCPLTGETITLTQPNPGKSLFKYKTSKTGEVIITDMAFSSVSGLSIEEKQILCGMTRNATIKKEELVVDSKLLTQLYDQNIPYAFEEKAIHFLQYLYDNGGKEYKSDFIDSASDSSITYSSREEFERVIGFSKSKGWISYNTKTGTQQGTLYLDLHIEEPGIKQIESGLPKMPLFGLVNQKISTGDVEIDKKIEHARLLFFEENSTLESKRSACENLSFVLEPLRENLNKIFEGDTEVFFRIVNDFAIRHNKERTKKLEHPEQIEWIFYSLLNTINTYCKMIAKVG